MAAAVRRRAVRHADGATEKHERHVDRRAAVPCTDDDVVVPIAVHVAGPRDAESKESICLVRLQNGVGVCRAAVADTCRASEEHERCAEAVIVGRADDDVGESVTVDVGSRYADAKLVHLKIRLQGGVGIRRAAVSDPGRASEEHECRSLVQLPGVVLGDSKYDVVITVAICVANSGDTVYGLYEELVRLQYRVGIRWATVSDTPGPPWNTNAAPLAVGPSG